MVANWIEGILQEPSFGRACDEIRECNAIFYGIGVYTVMELFFMAGLSILSHSLYILLTSSQGYRRS
jgi:DNA-binding transcriptional regulator LsrR (DeoR family)